jgi:predicted amidohydrolase YtcJ
MRSLRRVCVIAACLSVLLLIFAGPALGAKKCGHQPPKADEVYFNGNIYTVDKHFSRASAMAIKDGKFLAVGKNREMWRYVGFDTTVINLKGKTVFPGLWDAHLHFGSYGTSLTRLNLNGLQKDQVLAAVKAAADKALPGEWIRGSGWNQTLWTDQSGLVGGMPTAAMLQAVAPNNPVNLSRTGGHCNWVNQLLLDMSGITKDTPDVTGGTIIRYPDGTPTGVFLDKGSNLLKSPPPATEEQTRRDYLLSQAALFAFGNTSVCDMGSGQTVIDRMKSMYADGSMKIRVTQYVSVTDGPKYYGTPKSERVGLFGDRYTINGIKIVDDGTLGSAGAWMMLPYSDNALMGRAADWVGYPTFGTPYLDGSGNTILVPTIKQNADKLAEAMTPAVQAGFQVAVHCIGDATNRAYLDAVQAVETALPKLTRDPRFRDEHTQIVNVDDLKRFKPLKVIPSMQAQHATQDLTMAESRVGADRIKGGYAWRTLINYGNIIADGSDASVEVPNPWWGLFSAITRINKNGYNDGLPWYPEQCMTRAEALRSFTSWAAYAAFEEKDKGSIERNKLADFVIVGYPSPDQKDFMTMPAADIWKLQSNMTVVGGEVVYTAPGFNILK